MTKITEKWSRDFTKWRYPNDQERYGKVFRITSNEENASKSKENSTSPSEMAQWKAWQHQEWLKMYSGGQHTLIVKGWIVSILGIAGYMVSVKSTHWGLPRWRSGWESACQCRGHGFEPWSGKIPHAAEQLGPWATTTDPARLEPVLCNKRGHDNERPVHHDEEWPPLATTRENPRT